MNFHYHGLAPLSCLTNGPAVNEHRDELFRHYFTIPQAEDFRMPIKYWSFLMRQSRENKPRWSEYA